jgi:hypothetical protein
MGELNEAQARHLVTTFKHVDEVLSGALDVIRRRDSPFASCVQDLHPVQLQVLEGHVRDMRAAMARRLEQEGTSVPSPSIDASWACRTAIVSARIVVEELRARYLKGYGEVPEGAAMTLDEIVSELLEQLALMEAGLPPLRSGGGGGPKNRAAGPIQPESGVIQ